MDIAEVEETLFSIGEPKLHGGMCKTLCRIYCKVLELFPALEAARLRSTSGIQALCTLHIALEKTKNILQHCSECTKLYLAITGDSVVLKFEKALCVLEDSLRVVKDVVPRDIGCQISEILRELESIEFTLDPTEKQVGDDIVALLQQGRKFNSSNNENNELECFQKAASRIGITSSRAALRERRALKKLIERARAEEDKRKESIVAYLLHLMRKHSKIFRRDDNDSLSSPLASPTAQTPFGSYGDNKPYLKLSSFNFKPNFRRAGPAPVPPEELRCPISLQLMYDPVIIASGQTYERICIEKWFSDGHNTCPKTQQQLSYLGLTPNYSVKGMISSWCEHNGVPLPDGPPESLDLNYWRLSLSVSDSANLKSMDTISSCKINKDTKVVPFEENGVIEVVEEQVVWSDKKELPKDNVLEKYKELLKVMGEEEDLGGKCKVVEKVRHLLKNDGTARVYMGENGFVEALMKFLESAVHEKNDAAQEMGAMALFNLAVNNNKNKEMMLGAGVLTMLEEMITNPSAQGPASALYLNLSCYEEAKPIIGSSKAVPFLVQVLKSETDLQCKLDALHTLYNLSWLPANINHLLSASIINGLQALITDPNDHTWTEKCIAIYINLALSNSARDEMIAAPGVISSLSTILDVGEPVEQEQAATCLVHLCNENEKCSEMVLQEGVIPSLVSISVNGTVRGKQKAQKLLMMFREHAERAEQREREPAQQYCDQVAAERCESKSENQTATSSADQEQKPLSKSVSRRVMGKAWGYLWKYKSFSPGMDPGVWMRGNNTNNSTKKA